MAIIYLVTNKIDGKKYVGQTIVALALRWYRHVYAAMQGAQGVFQRAIKHHGRDAFTIEAIHTCAPSKLNAAERRFIKQYDCMAPKGYNLTSGGDAGKKVSALTRERMSKAQKGRKFSAASLLKMSEGQKARFAENPMPPCPAHTRKLRAENGRANPPSAQCKEAARQAALGRVPPAHEREATSKRFKGVPLTDEHRAKIGDAQRGVPKSPEAVAKGVATRRKNWLLRQTTQST